MVSQTQEQQVTQQTVRRQRATARPADAADSRAAVNRIARAWLLGALVAGIGVGLFVRFYGTHFEHLNTTDGVNAAQVARNVATGRGLKTGVIYPMYAALGNIEDSRHDIAVGPLYALSLGMFFKGRGADDNAVALFNGMLLFATAAFLYGIIKLLYDRPIALWAVLAYFVSMKAISQALAAGGATIGGLAVTATLYFALVAGRNATEEPPATPEQEEAEGPSLTARLSAFLRSPWPWTVLAGISVGLSYLTGVVGLIALAGMVWIAGRQGQRSRTALIVTAVLALIVVAPWVARNVKHFGAPTSPLNRYSLLMHTEQFPGRSFLWQTSGLPDNPELWALTHPRQMLNKVAVGITAYYSRVPELVNRYLFPFLLVGLLFVADTPPRRLLWGGLWFILLAQVLTSSLYTRDPDSLAVVTPIGIGLAVAALITLMRGRLQSRRVLLGIGLVAIVVIVWPYGASSIITPGGPVNPSRPALDLIAGQLPNQAVIATDIPWQVAWYGGNPAVLLPESVEQLQALAPAGVEPDVVYLSRDLRGARPEAGRETWARMLNTGQGVDQLPILGKAQMLPNGEALITLQHAQAMIDELRGRAPDTAEEAGETAEDGEPAAEGAATDQ